jgi:hypothetical protein
MFLCLFNSNVANAKSIDEARAAAEAYTDNDSAKLRKLCSYNKKCLHWLYGAGSFFVI